MAAGGPGTGQPPDLHTEAITIGDDVIGPIRLNELEAQLYHSPVVSRLARVKQLGLTYLVYPGASHSRLSHSLGVLHYSSAISRRLATVQAKEVDDPNFEEKERIAGLLHDIGHFPLSHCIEALFKRQLPANASAELVTTGSTNEITRHEVVDLLRKDLGADLPADPFDNSVVSAFLVAHSEIATHLSRAGIDPLDIAKIIVGRHPREFYSQIITGGLDADKLDYLQRDRKFTGVQYGDFDADTFVGATGLARDTLYFDEEVANACQHFLLYKYFRYSQVAYEKSVSILEEMARLVYDCLAANDLLPSALAVLDILKGIAEGDSSAANQWAEYDDNKFFDRMSRGFVDSQAKNWVDGCLSRETFREFVRRIREHRPLRTVARADAVELYQKLSMGREAWVSQHPRHARFLALQRWLREDLKAALDEHRVIIMDRGEPGYIYLTKAPEAEAPIYIKSLHDSKPIPLQEHYYSVFLPMTFSQDTPRLPVRFSPARVYACDELHDEVSKKWAEILGRPESDFQ